MITRVFSFQLVLGTFLLCRWFGTAYAQPQLRGLDEHCGTAVCSPPKVCCCPEQSFCEVPGIACNCCTGIGDGQGGWGCTNRGAFCFSSKSTLHVLNKGGVAMKDLQVGDSVLVGKGKYEPVYAFGVLSHTRSTDYLQIYTKGGGDHDSPLEITPHHLLYVKGKQYPMSAEHLQIGDYLQDAQGEDDALEIVDIKMVLLNGSYAPFTPSGSLVVEGIRTSTYASLQEGAKEFPELVNGMALPISQHRVIHMFTSPFRMACMHSSSSFCRSHNEDGHLPWVEFGIGCAKFADESSVVVQLVLLVLALVFWSPFYVSEAIFGPEYAPLVLGMIVMTMCFMQWKKRESSSRAAVTHKTDHSYFLLASES